MRVFRSKTHSVTVFRVCRRYLTVHRLLSRFPKRSTRVFSQVDFHDRDTLNRFVKIKATQDWLMFSVSFTKTFVESFGESVQDLLALSHCPSLNFSYVDELSRVFSVGFDKSFGEGVQLDDPFGASVQCLSVPFCFERSTRVLIQVGFHERYTLTGFAKSISKPSRQFRIRQVKVNFVQGKAADAIALRSLP